ncbi:MAG: hypothetical protein NTY74_03185 [Ignavibacteriae bacterium]|nr:hypothetical protein [Ignavibacteriota bacterium]
MDDRTKKILQFAGLDYKEYVSPKVDIEAQEKAIILKIKDILPNIEIVENKIVFTNIIKILNNKYPFLKFKFLKLKDDGTDKYKFLIVSNIFRHLNHFTYVFCNSESDLLGLLINIESLVSKDISSLQNYTGIYYNGKAELGILLNHKFNNVETVNNLLNEEFNFKINKKQIKVKIDKPTDVFEFVFDELRFNYKYCINIFNVDEIENSERDNIIDSILSTVIKIIMTHFGISVDYTNHIPLQKSNSYFNITVEKTAFNNIKLKKYNPVLLSYYNSALFIKSLNFQYLAFYNIIEYNFHQCYLDIYDKKSIENQKEKTLLQNVLEYFVKLEGFKKIFNLEDNIKSRIIGKDIKSETIRLTESHFYADLANHIYEIRNSIVHSKPDNEKLPLLNKYFDSHRQNLYDEVNLVKWIAKIIIEETSQNI